MPINTPKAYSFIPAFKPSNSTLRIPSFSQLRARGIIGGLYFRSIDVGYRQNKISVEILDDKVIIRNLNRTPKTLSYAGVGNGKISKVLLLRTTVAETITILAVTPTVLTVSGSVSGTLGNATVNAVFKSPVLVFQVTSGSIPFSPGDKFTVRVTASKEEFEYAAVDPLGPTAIEFRALIAGSSIIEALAPGIDVNYMGPDPDYISASPETFLSGGDGLPENASGIINGPDRTFAFVNYGEDYSGTMTNVNIVYEWAGSSAADGSWQDYQSR